MNQAPPATSTNPSFAVLLALRTLDERNGAGPHPLRRIVEISGLSTQAACRLLRKAEECHLVERPDTGFYRLAPAAPHLDGGPRARDAGMGFLWSKPEDSQAGAEAIGEQRLDEELPDPNYLLRDLQASTGCPAMLFSYSLMTGARARVLLSVAVGPEGTHLHVPRAHLIALRRAPLTADPAGMVIEAHLNPLEGLPLRLRRVRERSVAWGRSPIPGHGEIAAPIWNGSTVVGALALLVPEAVLHSAEARSALASSLSVAAATYSRHTTLDAALPTFGGEPVDDAGSQTPRVVWPHPGQSDVGGRGARSAPGQPLTRGLVPESVHQLLVDLEGRTGSMGLLFAPLLVARQPLRICLDRTFGPRSHPINAAPRSTAASQLWQAPLEQDAAGQVMLAHFESAAERSVPEHREIRTRGYAHSRSPLASSDLVAAPVWCDGTLAGAVAALVPAARLRDIGEHRSIVAAVIQTAGSLSVALAGTGTSHSEKCAV